MIRAERLKELLEEMKPGTRIESIHMNDPYTSLRRGDMGTVTDIDDTGTVFVSWDKGSSLGLVFGEDHYKKVVDK